MTFVPFCAAPSQPTEPQAESPLSQLRTKPEWTKNICPSWLSWGRLLSPHLGEDTPAPREELPGPQDPAATSHHRLVSSTCNSTITHTPLFLYLCIYSRCIFQQNRPPWMSSGPTENRNFHGMHGGPGGHGGPHSFPPPMPNMGGPPMPPNPNGMPPPWMQPPPPPMGQGPGPHGHPMGKN